MTCVEIGSTFKSNFFATCFSTLGFMLANVPTAPEIAQFYTSSVASANLFLFLLNSSSNEANFKPKVIGSA